MKCLCKIKEMRLTNDYLKNKNFGIDTIYDVTIGNIYEIYGQMIYGGILYYLIDPDGLYKPNWYPSDLFEIYEGSIPSNWHFKTISGCSVDDVSAIWGYFELVENPDHFNSLAEREGMALKIFESRARG